jgi:hypothetical protein
LISERTISVRIEAPSSIIVILMAAISGFEGHAGDMPEPTGLPIDRPQTQADLERLGGVGQIARPAAVARF